METSIESPLSHSEPSSSQTTSPSTTLSTCPTLERSVSGASSFSSSSFRSVSGTTQDGGNYNEGRRRGFIRPQATVFADSARNRDSVLALGTIAHLQHYFARTGLLDGKGAQLAREDKDSKTENGESKQFSSSENPTSDLTIDSLGDGLWNIHTIKYPEDAATLARTDRIHLTATLQDPDSGFNLPPTVSTYKQKPTYVPPPPDIKVLRRELREALEDAKNVLVELNDEEDAIGNEKDCQEDDNSLDDEKSQQGWHEVQGLHVLDLVTLAIRAARNYYTAHEFPRRLYSIRSERQIRSELYSVLDTLKRVATRNFRGGYRKGEVLKILEWIESIGDLVSQDEATEIKEQEQRQRWEWFDGDWQGREKEREWLFLKSFDHDPIETLPRWQDANVDASNHSFLLSLQNGLKLVLLHNELVRNSKRRFGEIISYHTDTSKPYRCTENLRYWIKAAELRWDLFLRVDVSGIVHGETSALEGFEAAILEWSRTVRLEISEDWKRNDIQNQAGTPVVQMERTCAIFQDQVEEKAPA